MDLLNDLHQLHRDYHLNRYLTIANNSSENSYANIFCLTYEIFILFFVDVTLYPILNFYDWMFFTPTSV